MKSMPIILEIGILLRLPLARTKKYQNSFRYNGAKTWNLLQSSFRIETCFSKFKIDLKKFLKAFKVFMKRLKIFSEIVLIL
jgi:hypothetical protein